VIEDLIVVSAVEQLDEFTHEVAIDDDLMVELPPHRGLPRQGPGQTARDRPGLVAPTETFCTAPNCTTEQTPRLGTGLHPQTPLAA
jgi:hypothetical protein